MDKNHLHLLFPLSILETSEILQAQIITPQICRAIYIPMYDAPSVLEDSVDNMKRYIFYNAQTYFKTFDNEHSFIFSSKYLDEYSEINFFATTLVRALYPTLSNSSFTIYGPTLIVGMDEDTNHCSVSYSILDATVNLMSRYRYEI